MIFFGVGIGALNQNAINIYAKFLQHLVQTNAGTHTKLRVFVVNGILIILRKTHIQMNRRIPVTIKSDIKSLAIRRSNTIRKSHIQRSVHQKQGIVQVQAFNGIGIVAIAVNMYVLVVII